MEVKPLESGKTADGDTVGGWRREARRLNDLARQRKADREAFEEAQRKLSEMQPTATKQAA
jgi:hypothetical protein